MSPYRQALRNNLGQFSPKEVMLVPSFQLGYFSGWLLGDGTLFKIKNGNYRIQFETTKVETIGLLTSVVKQLWPDINYLHSTRLKTRKFPNGTIRTNQLFSLTFNSKAIYKAFCPYKETGYYWRMPDFLNTIESELGFLRGIFDAEGCATKSWIGNNNYIHCRVTLVSKRESNLIPIIHLLRKFAIRSRLEKLQGGNQFRLVIARIADLTKFANQIGFGIKEKQNKLNYGLLEAKQRRSEKAKLHWITRKLRYGPSGRILGG